MERLIREIAVYSSISWYCGLGYRIPSNISIQLQEKESMIKLHDLGFLFDVATPFNDYNFFSSEEMKTILSISKNGNKIYKENFISSLKTLLSPKNVYYSQFLIQTFILKNISVFSLKSTIEKSEILSQEKDRIGEINLGNIKYIENDHSLIEKVKDEEADVYLYKMLKRKLKLQNKIQDKKEEIKSIPIQENEENEKMVLQKEFKKLTDLPFNVLERMSKKQNGYMVNKIFAEHFNQMNSVEEIFDALNS
jgi:mannose/fructose/N-acetylgalactosamine-specific phosphotransferase system component IIB